MDKNAIKKYAVWTRRELIERVSQKALQYGITADGKADPNADSVNGRLLSDAEKKQRQALIRKVNEQGYEQVMEEVAYTWFNRFAALRFMEVNGYLPSHVRVFTNDEGEFKPQILSEAIHLDLDGLNMEKVYELKNANKEEELFKYLLIVQCNALNKILPGMFQKIEDFTELLLPDYLLREGSVIERMVKQGDSDSIPEYDWTDQVQIIGWLYQYYNSEPKDKVFADLKKNIKITKENIPAATQLFTPDWIVRYMVENSLGRLWLEGHPNDALKSEWKYYLDEVEQKADVQNQLDTIRKDYAALKPEEIRCIDPCMGSGHILCYMFDVLVKIYEDYGHTAREAVTSIIENNLWGLDIDERAVQLSYFAVMMKARQYDRRFFNKKDENGNLAIPQPHVYAIEESNGITSAPMHDMGLNLTADEYEEAVKQAMRLVEEMHDAKEYGSIIHVTPCDWDLLRRFAVPRDENGQMHLDIHGEIEASARLQVLINIGEALAQKYHAVVTNPPYMNANGMNANLGDYIKKQYPNTRSDLSTVFMEKALNSCLPNGYMAMINIPVWMFITSYTNLRKEIIQRESIVNMLHLGRGIFGSDFGTTSFVIQNAEIRHKQSKFYKLYLRQGEVNSVEEKEKMFFDGIGEYISTQDSFDVIPDSPIAYWASHELLNDFEKGQLVSEFASPKQGMSTCDVNRFTKLWFEIPLEDTNISDPLNFNKWVRYNKGGSFRKWYGNREHLVYWGNDGSALLSNGALLRNRDVYFRPFLAWTKISSAGTGFRRFEDNFLFDGAGGSLFNKKCGVDDDYLLGLLNSKVNTLILNLISPTLNFNENHIGSIPVIRCKDSNTLEIIHSLVEKSVAQSRADWDAFETSWDFQSHPLAPLAYERQEQLSAGMNSEARKKAVTLLSERYRRWEQECEYRFSELKKNEEELNRIFIDIYGLQDELTPEVEDKDVTVRKADLQRDIRSLLSYAVGCMFGRYSLDMPGLVYAGGTWDASKYTTFQPDKDAIIPICDDEYFDDDIVGRFVKFIEVVYGKETLEENLKFIADALGGKGTSREVIRNYFMNDFYADHLKVYQKRPIYWLFDSGKKNGFKCLVYMHRYQPDTIARIRTDYVHEQQSRYRTAIADLEQRVNGASTSERVKLNKQLSTIQAQATEIREYEEKIHHLADQMIRIDLDDGVKHNYEIFKDVLAKIK